MDSQTVLRFWFQELQPEQWFRKDTELDLQIRIRFSELHQKAARCELWSWRETVHGRLAEILILDQFSRHLYRGQAQAFSQDILALALSQEALLTADYRSLSVTERAFLYMPFMHSESPLIHEKAIELFSELGMEENLAYEQLHKKIVDRFGRFPHRNQALGRKSTPEEIEFLKQPGSSF